MFRMLELKEKVFKFVNVAIFSTSLTNKEGRNWRIYTYVVYTDNMKIYFSCTAIIIGGEIFN